MSQILFERTPEINRLLANERKQIQNKFTQFASMQNIAHDWIFPIRYLNWLILQPDWGSQITKVHRREALNAAAITWSLMGMESLGVAGIMLVSQHLCDEAVLLWKSQAPERSHELVLLQVLPGRHPGRDACVFLQTYGVLAAAEWLALPE
jgi:hypothetical protein